LNTQNPDKKKYGTLHGVWHYWGLTNKFSAFGSLPGFGSGLTFSIWLLVVIFNFSNNIGLQFWADDFQIPQQRQALPLYAIFLTYSN